MSGDEFLVVLVGVGAIAWVNWYFLLPGRRRSQRDRHEVRGGSDREMVP